MLRARSALAQKKHPKGIHSTQMAVVRLLKTGVVLDRNWYSGCDAQDAVGIAHETADWIVAVLISLEADDAIYGRFPKQLRSMT